jgi:hypothetical protein
MKALNDISIEIYNALLGYVSNNVYDEYAPKKITETATDFIVYNVGYVRPQHDFESGEAFRSYVMITCFAKDKANGIKNTAKLKTMSDALTQAVGSISTLRMSLSSIEVSSTRIEGYTGQTIIYNIYKKD